MKVSSEKSIYPDTPCLPIVRNLESNFGIRLCLPSINLVLSEAEVNFLRKHLPGCKFGDMRTNMQVCENLTIVTVQRLASSKGWKENKQQACVSEKIIVSYRSSNTE